MRETEGEGAEEDEELKVEEQEWVERRVMERLVVLVGENDTSSNLLWTKRKKQE
jgi:hypothetical protein